MNTLHKAWTVVGSSLPMAALRKHRHVLLAPLFLVVVSASLGDVGRVSPTGDVAGIPDPSLHAIAGGVVRTGNDATYVASEGALTLRDGTAFAAGKGLMRIAADDATVSGWNGAFETVLHNGALTVAAVSTPAVVRVGSGVVIVPIGMQWRADLPTLSVQTGAVLRSAINAVGPGALPSQYLAERRADERVLGAVAFPQETAVTAPSGFAALFSDIPQPDSSVQQRAEAVEALHNAVGHPGLMADLLHSQGTVLFGGDEGQELLADILADPAVTPQSVTVLLSFVSDADLRMLLAVHPALRTEGLAAFDGTDESRGALLMGIALLDTQPDPLPSWLVTRWEEGLHEALQATPERAAVLQELLTGIRRGVEAQRSRGYFSRMQRYASAAAGLAEAFEASDDMQDLLSAITEAGTPPAVELPESQTEAAALQGQPLTDADIQRLQGVVRDMLRAQGGILTKNTELHVRSLHAVDVRGVAFATPTGDELFSFTVDPDGQMLSSIVRKGVVQSFSVTLGQFLEWISQP